MNVETCPSSSSASSPTVGRTLGEDREKSSLDLSGPRNVVDSPISQDTMSDAAQPTQCTSTTRRRRIRNKCIEQFKEMSRSMTLENSGSVARDHLACERTFLAYVRTSIGCSTMGVALVQLFSLNATNITSNIPRVGNVLGAIVVLMGMVVLILGSTRYFYIQNALLDGKYMTAGYLVLFISLFIAAVIIVMFGVLVAVAAMS